MFSAPSADTSPMRGGSIVLALALALAASPARAATDAYRPDAWLKLCGLSTGCTIDPLPHPWKGDDVYNTSGARQSLAIRMEDGEGVRFWIRVETDGASDDTILVQGCQGTRRFVVNKVLLGKQKRPHAGTTDVTAAFKDGTLAFPVTALDGSHAVFTLNIIAPTTAEGITYRCPVTISSQADPTVTDTVAVTMTTY